MHALQILCLATCCLAGEDVASIGSCCYRVLDNDHERFAPQNSMALSCLPRHAPFIEQVLSDAPPSLASRHGQLAFKCTCICTQHLQIHQVIVLLQTLSIAWTCEQTTPATARCSQVVAATVLICSAHRCGKTPTKVVAKQHGQLKSDTWWLVHQAWALTPGSCITVARLGMWGCAQRQSRTQLQSQTPHNVVQVLWCR